MKISKRVLVVPVAVLVLALRSLAAACSRRGVSVVLVVVLVLSFFYVWPGVWRYQYERDYMEDERYWTVRFDRLTGDVQGWHRGKWHSYPSK